MLYICSIKTIGAQKIPKVKFSLIQKDNHEKTLEIDAWCFVRVRRYQAEVDFTGHWSGQIDQ